MLNQDTSQDIAPRTSAAHPSLNDHDYCSTAPIKTVQEEEIKKRRRIISRDSDHLYEEDLSSDLSSSEGEQDDDSENDDSEDDPDKLWCVCQKPYDNKFMISCDVCEYWFHGNCVGIKRTVGQRFSKEGKEWFCQECQDKLNSGIPREAIPSKIVKKEKKKKKPPTPGKRGRGRPRKSESGAKETTIRPSTRNTRKSLDSKLGFDNGRLMRRSSSRPEARIETFDEFEDSQRLKVLIKERKKEFFYKRQLAEQQKAVKRNELGLSRRTLTANLGGSLDSLASSTNTPNMNNLPINIKSEHGKERHKPPIVIQINTKKEPGSDSGNSKIVTTIVKQPPKKLNSPDLSNSSLNDLFTAEPIQISKKHKTHPDVIPESTSTNNDIKIHSTCASLKNEKLPTEQSGDQAQKRKRKDSEFSIPNGSTPPGSNIICQKIRETLLSRSKQIKDISVSDEKIDLLSRDIENQLNECFKEGTQKYLNKFRSLMFNLRDNKNQCLVTNVLSGDITPSRLVRMSPDEMASNELAKWRERENKHSIELIKRDAQLAAQQVIVKKTHKGEEVISALSLEDSTAEVANQEPPTTPNKSTKDSFKTKVNPEGSTKPTTPTIKISPIIKPHRDLTSLPVSPKEEKTQVQDNSKFDNPVNIKTESITIVEEKHIDIEQKSCESITHSQPKRFSVTIQSSLNPADLSRLKEPLVKPAERTLGDETNDYNSMTPSEEHRTPPISRDEVDDEVDDLEYDPEAAPPGLEDVGQPMYNMDPAPSGLEVNQISIESETNNTTNIVWSGTIYMPDVAKFKSSAKVIDGGAQFMNDEVNHELMVCGRIAPDQMQLYLKKIRTTTKNQILIIQLFPQEPADKENFNSFFDYLYSRNRYGVVQTNPQILKDFYILPLHDRSSIPEVLKPMKNTSLDRKDNPNCLVGVLVKSKR